MSTDTRTFYLKYRDTLPILDVVLYPPGQEVGGTPQDLTGTTGWKLHITCPDGKKLIRSMTKVGPDIDGKLRYAWLATDWDAASAADGAGQYTVGGLVVGNLSMEYEVLGAGSARLTFPNDSEHRLSIRQDLGQG